MRPVYLLGLAAACGGGGPAPAPPPSPAALPSSLTAGSLRAAQVNGTTLTYRVLVYSRRYHPPNPPQNDAQTYSPMLHAEDLAALLLQLDLAPAHVVGSSYGAYTALVLALDRKSTRLNSSHITISYAVFCL